MLNSVLRVGTVATVALSTVHNTSAATVPGVSAAAATVTGVSAAAATVPGVPAIENPLKAVEAENKKGLSLEEEAKTKKEEENIDEAKELYRRAYKKFSKANEKASAISWLKTDVYSNNANRVKRELNKLLSNQEL